MTAVDLAALIAAADAPGADGVHWTLDAPNDLNVNLVRLDPGHAVGAHVNDAVDVLVVVVEGTGTLAVDGATQRLAPRTLAAVRRGADRRIEAGEDGLWYLTVHRRKGALTIDTARD